MNQICLRLEIFFWNLAIQALSNSTTLRGAIKSVYQFGREKRFTVWLILAGSGMLAGFIGGLAVYHFASHLN